MDDKATFDPDTFDFAKNTLKQLNHHGSNGANRNDKSIDHDARLLTSIDGMQKKNPTTPTIGPYALSFDNLVTNVSEIGTNEYWQERAVIQPRKWLNYLLAFTPSSMSEEEKRETSIAVIQSTTNFEDTLSVDEYTELLIPKIQLKSDDKDLLTDYLISHPKSRELQSALDSNRGSEAEQAVRDMLSDESRLEMFSKQRDMGSKLKKMRKSLEQERKRADNERQRRKAIEEATQTDASDNSMTINVNASAVADTEVNNSIEVAQFNDQLNNFIRLLDSTLPTGIEQSELPDPPEDESDLPSVKQWLSAVSAGLATEGIAAHAGVLQPMAQQLLDQAINLL